MASDAVGSERISRVVGYKLTGADFSETTPNLPQRIAIIGEGNTLSQSNFDGSPVNITSAKQAGEIFGYGSPIHMVMRILRPVSGDGIGGIPTVVYPQLEAATPGATSVKYTVTVVGTATKNYTHYVRIGGRDNVDGNYYAVNIVKGNTATQIALKMHNAILSVLGSPMKSTVASAVVTVESKWKGLTADSLIIEVDTNGDAAGITYAVTGTQTGAGTPDIADALALFADEWNTIVVNTYGTSETICDALQEFNGVPDPSTPSGRYSATVMKPFIALTGTSEQDMTEWTDARKDEVTIALCPAPGTKALAAEIAASYCLEFARTAQDKPHLDIAGKFLKDIPVALPLSVTMNDYNVRDSYVKLGSSTVTLVGDRYKIQDFVTTYHPTGEAVPQYRYCRNLMLDYNVRFGYFLLEQINVVDHVIVPDSQTVTASKFIKPKQWKAVLNNYAADLAARALIAEPDFMTDSIVVNISGSNPDRLETFFRYKRSGIARIASTTAEAGFNFG